MQPHEYLHIPSSRRLYGTSSNYLIQLTDAKRNIKGARFISCQYSNLFYNINDSNDTFHFESPAGTPFTVTLTHGLYTVTEFLDHLKDVMDTAAAPTVFTWTYNTPTPDRRVHCSSSVNHRLMFGTLYNSSTGIGTKPNLAYTLGYDLIDYPDQATTDAPNIYDGTASIHTIYLLIPELANQDQYDTVSKPTTSNCFASIPVDYSTTSGLITYEPFPHIQPKFTHTVSASFTDLEIKWVYMLPNDDEWEVPFPPGTDHFIQIEIFETLLHFFNIFFSFVYFDTEHEDLLLLFFFFPIVLIFLESH